MNRQAMVVLAAIALSIGATAVQGAEAESKAYGALTLWPDSGVFEWLDSGYGYSFAAVQGDPTVEDNPGARDSWAVVTATAPAAVAEGATGAYASTDWSSTPVSVYDTAYIEARGLASPSGLTGTHGAYAYADLWYQIVAIEGGELTFAMDWEAHQSRSTSFPDEWAWTDGSFGIGLVGGEYYASTRTWEWEVTDALIETNVDFTSGTVSVSRTFAPGETAWLWIAVDARAEAHTIPAPAAAVLAFLGLGTVGRLRRRFM